MTTYSIKAPNGQTYQIEGPEGASQEQVQAEVMRQHPDAAAPISDANSAAAQAVDGGAGQATSPEAVAGSPPTQSRPQPITLGAPGADATVIGAPTQNLFGDQHDQTRPNLKLAPDQEAQVVHILATAPIGEAANAARTYLRSIGWPGTSGDNFDAVIDARKKTGSVNEQFSYGKPSTVEGGNSGAIGAGLIDLVPGASKAGAALDAGIDYISGNTKNGSFGNDYNGRIDQYEAQRDNDRSAHPIAYYGTQLATALLAPTRASALADEAALAAGSRVLHSGGTMAEARAAAAAAGRSAFGNRAAVEGAAYNGAEGALNADNPQDAVINGTVGAITGALTGKGIGEAGRFIQPKVVAPLTAGQETLAAADRLAPFNSGQSLDLLPADVGGPGTRRATGALAQSVVGGSPIITAGKRVLDQGKTVLGNIANSAGPAADVEAAGVAAQDSAQNWMQRSASRIGKIYDSARDMSKDAQLELPTAKSLVDQQVARLAGVPGASDTTTSAGKALAEAQALRSSLDGKFGVQGVRDMRTEMFVAPDFRGTPAEGRMKQVVGAASQDIEDGLRAQGMGSAADAFKSADRQWSERLDTIDRFIQPVIGTAAKPKSGEGVINAIGTAARGDTKKLAGFLNTLSPEERGIVSGTIINRLGTKPANQAEDSSFSFNDFLTNWNRISPASKRELFGPEAKAALDDLATVAGGTQGAQKYANHSNTGGVNWFNTMSAMGTQAPTLALLSHPILGVLSASPAAMQFIGGRLLASPKFARWLARSPKDTGKSGAWVAGLSRIARAEPQLANDIFGLQKTLSDAFSGGTPLRAAANQDAQESSIANGQAPQNQPQYEGAQP